jgi:hypothetical protein
MQFKFLKHKWKIVETVVFHICLKFNAVMSKSVDIAETYFHTRKFQELYCSSLEEINYINK